MDSPGAIIITVILVMVFLPLLMNPLGTLRLLFGISTLFSWIWASLPGHAWWWWLVAGGSAVMFLLITFNTEPVRDRR